MRQISPIYFEATQKFSPKVTHRTNEYVEAVKGMFESDASLGFLLNFLTDHRKTTDMKDFVDIYRETIVGSGYIGASVRSSLHLCHNSNKGPRHFSDDTDPTVVNRAKN